MSITTQTLADLINAHCLARLHFNTSSLVLRYPPNFSSSNKTFVYQTSCPRGAEDHAGELRYAQYKNAPVPSEFGPKKTEIVGEAGVFKYDPPEDPAGSVEWHLNFADSNLFGYWRGSLFAQDESQTLEHPSLCSLTSLLTSNPAYPGDLSRTVGYPAHPTPVLIRGVERKSCIDTSPSSSRPYGLYGNKFAHALRDTVSDALTTFTGPRLGRDGQPYYSNILAIEAPSHGSGAYSLSILQRVVDTAYAGFVAAQCEALVELGRIVIEPTPSDKFESKSDLVAKPAQPLDADLPKTIIHTGNWGCGAYGGNLIVMYLMQMAAAELAQVEKIVFHVVNDIEAWEDAKKWYDELRGKGDEELKVVEFLKKVEERKLNWGWSDGN